MNCLRPYQNKVLTEARTWFRNGGKSPCIVAPCGAGKSVIISDLCKSASQKGNDVIVIIHRQELKDQLEATISSWGADMNHVDICMVQTLVRRVHKQKRPSVIIVDECHHILSNSYLKILNHFSDAFIVGFTATPIRLDGRGLGDVCDKLIIAPSVKELIEMKNLSPATYYGFNSVNTSNLKIQAGDFTFDEDFGKTIYGDVIASYREHANGMKAICYCHSIAYSKSVAERFSQEGIPAAHIDGTTNKAERKQIIQDFRDGKIKILCNVDIVGEGFDVPDCEAVILLRPTCSLALHIQQSMRCMRYKEGKQAVIIDHVGNYKRHGLPTTDRVWSLDAPKKKKARQEDTTAIRQCSECFAVYEAKEKACPYCGYVPATKEREIEERKDAKLTVIEDKPFRFDLKEPKDCKSMAELYELAKRKGYKRGWAYYQGKQLHLI